MREGDKVRRPAGWLMIEDFDVTAEKETAVYVCYAFRQEKKKPAEKGGPGACDVKNRVIPADVNWIPR